MLTEVGQRYYYQSQQALEAFKLAEDLVQADQIMPEGVLKVVANQFYANHFILPKLEEFLQNYPKVQFKLNVAEILPDFKKTQMDILFGIGLKGSDDLVQKRIDHWRYVLCASHRYFKRKGMPETTAELLQHDLIAHGSRQNPEVLFLDDEKPITMRPKLAINQSNCLIEAALQHLGIIWVPEPFVRTYLKQRKLKEVLTRYNQRQINVYLYYQYQKFLDPKIKAFVRHFSQK